MTAPLAAERVTERCAGDLRMFDRFEFQADSWSKPRVLECWTYPRWGIVRGEVVFEARRILATGKPSLEPPFTVSVPAAFCLNVVARMIPVSADDLERIAFDTGAEISMGGRHPTLTIGRITYAAVDTPAVSVAPVRSGL